MYCLPYYLVSAYLYQLGNIGNLAYPTDLYAFQEVSNWYAYTVNSESGTITRSVFCNFRRGWDGTYIDKLQPAGSYVYRIEYTFYGETEKVYQQKGGITLVR